MNDVTDAREQLATLIRTAYGAGSAVVVDSYVPEELAERHVVIQLPANALRQSPTLGGSAHYELTLEVYLLLAGLGNEEVHDAVDDFLTRLLPALAASAVWRVVDGSLSSIQTIQTAQGASPGVSLSVTAPHFTLTPQE